MTGQDEPIERAESSSAAGTLSEAELIERIYKIALEPHSYDDFMAHWDSYVTEALANLSQLKSNAAASHGLPGSERVASHFEIGFRLIEEMGRNSPATFFESQLQGSDLPKVLLNAQGTVVWYNNAAKRMLPLRRESDFVGIGLDARSRGVLEDLLERMRTDAPPRETSVVRLDRAGEQPLYLLASTTTDRSGDQLLVLQQAASEWRPAVDRMLVDAFGLSVAEIGIVRLLTEGHAVAEIAELRGSTLNTVRTQIKTILAKTGAKSQTALVRLAYSLIRVAEQDTRTPRTAIEPASRHIRARSGRRVPVHLIGPAGGQAVVFIHGMLDGFSMPQRCVELLHEKNIRLILPERPWFGKSDPDKGDIRTAPDRFALEVEDVIDELGVRSAVLVGHKAGSVYSFTTAQHLKSRAIGVINMASGVPIISHEQFAFMSRRQRLVAYTARYTPKLLPFVVRAGIRQLDFGGENSFMYALYEGHPHDIEAISNTEIFDILCQGYHYTIAQGHRAFEIDSYHVVRDWSPRTKLDKTPVILIHGRHDPVVDAATVEAFAERLGPNASVIMREDRGQLLFYQNPELLFDALDRIL